MIRKNISKPSRKEDKQHKTPQIKQKNKVIQNKQHIIQNIISHTEEPKVDIKSQIASPSIKSDKLENVSNKSGLQRTLTNQSNISNTNQQFISIIQASIQYYESDQQQDFKIKHEHIEDELSKKQKKINLYNKQIIETQKQLSQFKESNQRDQNDFAILRYVTQKEKSLNSNQKQILEQLQNEIDEKQEKLNELYIKFGHQLQKTDNMNNAIRRILRQTPQQLLEEPPLSLRQITVQKQFLHLKNQYELAQKELTKAQELYDSMKQNYEEKSEKLTTLHQNFENEKKLRIQLQELRKIRFLSSIGSEISLGPCTARDNINLSIPNTER